MVAAALRCLLRLLLLRPACLLRVWRPQASPQSPHGVPAGCLRGRAPVVVLWGVKGMRENVVEGWGGTVHRHVCLACSKHSIRRCDAMPRPADSGNHATSRAHSSAPTHTPHPTQATATTARTSRWESAQQPWRGAWQVSGTSPLPPSFFHDLLPPITPHVQPTTPQETWS